MSDRDRLHMIEMLGWISAITSTALLGMMILVAWQLNRISERFPELVANQQAILEAVAGEANDER